MTELNILNLTVDEVPTLSPLSKGLSKNRSGPKQSDILKVNKIFNTLTLNTCIF